MIFNNQYLINRIVKMALLKKVYKEYLISLQNIFFLLSIRFKVSFNFSTLLESNYITITMRKKNFNSFSFLSLVFLFPTSSFYRIS